MCQNLHGAPVLKLADGYEKDPPANAMTVRQTYEVCLQIGTNPVRLDCLLDQGTADDFGILAVKAGVSGAPAEIVIEIEDTIVEDMQFFENWYWDMWDNDNVEIVLGGYDPED